MKLYKFFWDCGRSGDVEGLFIADEATIKETIGKEIYFGEILGKHSEVYGPLEEGDLTVISDDLEKINWLREVIGSYTISGYNPLDYLPEEYDEDEE